MNTPNDRVSGLSRGLVAELTVHAGDSSLVSQAALAWLTDGVERASGGLDVRGLTPLAKVSVAGYKNIPRSLLEGRTGGRWGYISASPADSWDVLYNPYCPQTLGWLRDQIEKRAEDISVEVGIFQADEAAGSALARLSVAFDEDMEDHVRLRYHVEEQALVDAATSADTQHRMEVTLREFSNSYPVVFGHVSYDAANAKTELEKYLRGIQSSPAANTVEQQDRLRGYSWITVISPEALPGLGGVDVLRANEAFIEVDVLPNGAVWLKATKNYVEYDATQVCKVWRALRNSLIPGTPQPPVKRPGVPVGDPTWMVVF